MKNTLLKLGGVLALAGVGYYFYNKNKSPMSKVSATNIGEPNKTGFDREKASKELAKAFFPKLNKKSSTQMQPVRIDGNTGLQVALPIKRNVLSEIALYNKFLAGLNGILDDSDAEFIFTTFKKYAEAKDDREFKPDLDAQIRLEKIQKKYPVAIKEIDFS
jgi:hypothetical protein